MVGSFVLCSMLGRKAWIRWSAVGRWTMSWTMFGVRARFCDRFDASLFLSPQHTLGHTPETWHSEARKKTQISEILGITALNFQTT